MAHTATKQYRILIAGAGLGGLTAASCLMKAGHRVEIYEQAPQLGEIGELAKMTNSAAPARLALAERDLNLYSTVSRV